MVDDIVWVAHYNNLGYGVAGLGYLAGAVSLLGGKKVHPICLEHLRKDEIEWARKYPGIEGKKDLVDSIRSIPEGDRYIGVYSGAPSPGHVVAHHASHKVCYSVIRRFRRQFRNAVILFPYEGNTKFIERADYAPLLNGGDLAKCCNLTFIVFVKEAVEKVSEWIAHSSGCHPSDLKKIKVGYAPHAMKLSPNEIIPNAYETGYDKILPYWEKNLCIKFPRDTVVAGISGKWELRKGSRRAVYAFTKAIGNRPYLLIARVFNPFMSSKYPMELIEMIGGAKVDFIDDKEKGIKGLLARKNKYQAAFIPEPDCNREKYLSELPMVHFTINPSMVEGFNLSLFESLSLGVPAVATRCLGHREYYRESRYSVDGILGSGRIDKFLKKVDSLNEVDVLENLFPLSSVVEDFDLDELIYKVSLAIEDSKEVRVEEGKFHKQKCDQYSWEESARTILEAL